MKYHDSVGQPDATAAGGGPVEFSERSEHSSGPREGRAKRRTFTAEFKRRMVAEYDAAPKGSKGLVLRGVRRGSEGFEGTGVASRATLRLPHSGMAAAIEAGTLDTPPRRGRPKGSGRSLSPEQARIAELERANARLQAELDKKDEVIAEREDALEVLGRGVAFLEALSSRNAR